MDVNDGHHSAFERRTDGGTSVLVRYTVVNGEFKPEYLPQYASTGAAGMDLHACLPSALVIDPMERARIPTGIAMQLPDSGFVGLVYARSGLAWRHGIALPNGVGVIDSDYTGEIQVLLTNFSDAPVTILPGDRIAQLVIAPVFLAQWVRTDTLSKTDRGEGGFGSTGISPVGDSQAMG